MPDFPISRSTKDTAILTPAVIYKTENLTKPPAPTCVLLCAKKDYLAKMYTDLDFVSEALGKDGRRFGKGKGSAPFFAVDEHQQRFKRLNRTHRHLLRHRSIIYIYITLHLFSSLLFED